MTRGAHAGILARHKETNTELETEADKCWQTDKLRRRKTKYTWKSETNEEQVKLIKGERKHRETGTTRDKDLTK